MDVLWIFLLTCFVSTNCFDASKQTPKQNDNQAAATVEFLQKSVQLPFGVSVEMLNTIRQVLRRYENQVILLSNKANDCLRFENENCAEISNRLKTVRENLQRELDEMRQRIQNSIQVLPNSKYFFGNSIFFDRVYSVFRDYTLHINFNLSVDRSTVASSSTTSAPTTAAPTKPPATTMPVQMPPAQMPPAGDMPGMPQPGDMPGMPPAES